ncbi:MAG: SoxR reducing system RseC family protein [Desulfobacterales bacterium]
MATEQGRVLRIVEGVALVKTMKSEACAACSAQHSCTTKGNDMEVEAVNRVGAKQGDEVVIQIDTRPFLKATFMLYLFPILFMIFGAMIGEKLAPRFLMDPSVLSAVLAFSFFFVSVWVVKKTGNEMGNKEEYRPRIIRVLKRKAAAAHPEID